MIGKCCACDIRLSSRDCATDAEMCPRCRAEHTAAYHANRFRLLARLLTLMLICQLRNEGAESGH